MKITIHDLKIVLEEVQIEAGARFVPLDGPIKYFVKILAAIRVGPALRVGGLYGYASLSRGGLFLSRGGPTTTKSHSISPFG